MPKTGGARPGAGRKRGSLNRKSVELLQGAVSEGMSPVEFMLSLMRDEDEDPKRRAWAAERAAPFVHPRPAPAQRAIKLDVPPITSGKDIPAAVAFVMSAVACGEITPAEAQSLVAIMDVQRKAIETGEILDRLERLEEKETGR